MNKLVFRNCPYCVHNNADHTSTHFGDATWIIKSCRSCSFVYIETAPIYESLSEDFAWEKTSVAEKVRRISKEPIKQFISEKLKSFRRNILKRNKLPKLIQKYSRRATYQIQVAQQAVFLLILTRYISLTAQKYQGIWHIVLMSKSSFVVAMLCIMTPCQD